MLDTRCTYRHCATSCIFESVILGRNNQLLSKERLCTSCRCRVLSSHDRSVGARLSFKVFQCGVPCCHHSKLLTRLYSLRTPSMQVRHHTKLSQQQDLVTDTRCARYETVQTGVVPRRCWASSLRCRRPRYLAVRAVLYLTVSLLFS